MDGSLEASGTCTIIRFHTFQTIVADFGGSLKNFKQIIHNELENLFKILYRRSCRSGRLWHRLRRVRPDRFGSFRTVWMDRRRKSPRKSSVCTCWQEFLGFVSVVLFHLPVTRSINLTRIIFELIKMIVQTFNWFLPSKSRNSSIC
jgi:hypothetical protein